MRVSLWRFSSSVSLRGPAAMGHPWPSAANPASMPGCPLRQNRNEASRWGKKIKSQSDSNSNSEAADGPT